jgi:hypothetical protein
MPDNPDPAASRRTLRMELRRLREARGWSHHDAGATLSWEPNKLLHIENGIVGIIPTDLTTLLNAYGVNDQSHIEQLFRLAETSRHLPTAAYQAVPQSTIKFWNLRSSAVRVRQLETLLIPGLLQTESYAREVIRAYSTPALSEGDIENRVSARLDQQALLVRDNRPHLYFLIDEAALLRPVGGREVMRRQLEQLKRLADVPRLSVQVLSLQLGAHSGIRGPFQILEFVDDDFVLYLDDLAGGKTTRDMEHETLEYLSVFWELEAIATRPNDLPDAIDRIIAGMAD